jgi:hypothetical protein
MHSDRGAVPDAASDLLSAVAFPNVDASSEVLDARAGGWRF